MELSQKKKLAIKTVKISSYEKKAHGFADYGKDMGKLGRDMEPNYGFRDVIYAHAGAMEERA